MLWPYSSVCSSGVHDSIYFGRTERFAHSSRVYYPNLHTHSLNIPMGEGEHLIRKTFGIILSIHCASSELKNS